jgi:hypothetical protein
MSRKFVAPPLDKHEVKVNADKVKVGDLIDLQSCQYFDQNRLAIKCMYGKVEKVDADEIGITIYTDLGSAYMPLNCVIHRKVPQSKQKP